MSNLQKAAWLFTHNNPENNDFPKLWPGVRYLAYQLERGDNGTPHLQGYVIFKRKKRPGALKKLDPRAHWEARLGTHEQALKYVTKEDTRQAGPWMCGDPPNPGKRTDILAVKDSIDEGARESDLWEKHFSAMVRHHRAFAQYNLVRQRKRRREEPEVVVIYGPTGVGKSHLAQEVLKDPFWLEKAKGGKGAWFDGYDAHREMVIDEFYGWLPFSRMLRILDKWPCKVETKGGTRPLLASKFIITSNCHPREWYKNLPSYRLPALQRRLQTILFMPERGKIYEVPLDISCGY